MLPTAMGNVLSETKKQQVIALGRLKWSLRRIERETGVRRETASAYLKAAGVEVRAPRHWGKPPKPAKEVITDSVGTTAGVEAAAWPPTASKNPQTSACEPYRTFIEQARGNGRNSMAIWQDLVSDYGFEGRYSAVQRFVRKLGADAGSVKHAHAIIETAPGQEAQVDYGEGPMVRDPNSGKYRRPRLFVLTLGYSRKAVRLLTWRSSSRIWAQLHETSFRRLGGVPRVIVLDNLREGVIKTDIYDPDLNPLYRDMLTHYGAVGLPCKVRDPDRKGKVESSIGHTQRTPLCGMRFDTIEDAQTYLDRWDSTWADTRIHGTTKRQVLAMFDEEKPALQPLPVEPFRAYAFGERVVSRQGCVEVEGAYYGAPPGLLGQSLQVQWDEVHVRLIDPKTNGLLREHLRERAGHHRIAPEDLTQRTPKKVTELLKRASALGPSIGSLCVAIHGNDGELAERRILGVLNLSKRHGPAAVEKACAEAVELSVQSYRFVRRYLERLPSVPITLKQIDPLIRELNHYRDIINSIT
jgi:transposase